MMPACTTETIRPAQVFGNYYHAYLSPAYLSCNQIYPNPELFSLSLSVRMTYMIVEPGGVYFYLRFSISAFHNNF